jgi:hypothetical protein
MKSNYRKKDFGFKLACLGFQFIFLLLPLSPAPNHSQPHPEVIDIGSRLELFVDDFLIESINGVFLKLHNPLPKEVVIVFDKPWEGNTSAYVTVFKDNDIFRMYYRGSNFNLETQEDGPQVVCYAESRDGIHWVRPELGIHEFNGTKNNNIVWKEIGAHNFTPFKDTNPLCRPDERYKALGSEKERLYAFKSPDGIHWKLLQGEPILSKGAFDSQNLSFWDSLRKKYLEYHRGWRNDIRDIMVSFSEDFRNWTEPQWLDWGKMPPEHLYTNAITPYFRAPHILLGFPKRFVPERKIGTHIVGGVSDGLFMSSRDGLHWRRWGEAFIRPGLQKERWVNRNNMTAWGILVTKSDIPGLPDELSIYSSEGYYLKACRLRRFTLRLDGFVSVHAPYEGGEITTRPIIFSGENLFLNFSTSAAGKILVEIQDEKENPIKGFTLHDSPEIYGDEIEYVVKWKSGASIRELAGKSIRLHFVMKDADLYSMRFN